MATVPSQHTALCDTMWGLRRLSAALNLTFHEGPITLQEHDPSQSLTSSTSVTSLSMTRSPGRGDPPSLQQRAVAEAEAIAVITVLPQYEIFAVSALPSPGLGTPFPGSRGLLMVRELCY